MQLLDVGLYIHVPFCQVRCSYCDFNTYAGLGHLIDDYVAALCTEIQQRSTSHPYRAITIYFGGGTPSLLTGAHLDRILTSCYDAFTIADDVEITIEANPGTVSPDSLRAMRHLGVNRLSLGVQSLDDAMLRLLDRLHNAEQAREAYIAARQAGFGNINLDFMYGLPGQTVEHWRQTLAQAIALQADHLSLYALTLEKHVPMARRVAAGGLTLPDDDTVADMYTLAEDMLGDAGYLHYEISNWAKINHGSNVPCFISRHNSLYWQRRPYLGFGAGAHSFDGRRRFSNVLHPRRYIEKVNATGSAEVESETITPQIAMAETMFLSLRLLQEGVTADDFTARHGQSWDIFAAQIRELSDLGLLEQRNGRLLLTRRGRLLSNQVFVRFLP